MYSSQQDDEQSWNNCRNNYESYFICSNKGAYILVNLNEIKQLIREGVFWDLNPDLTEA